MSKPAVRTNVVANYFGSIVTFLLSFLFTPMYVRLLGVEGYGLIGFFSSITALISLADFGMGTTLARELAIGTAGPESAGNPRDLVYSLEIIYFVIGVLGATVLVLICPMLESKWIHSNTLGKVTVLQSLQIMSISFGLRWCSSLYLAGMVGLQRQIAVNIIEAGTAAAQYGGAIAFLGLAHKSIVAFFVYQAIISLIRTVIARALLWKRLPRGQRRARWTNAGLLRLRGFAIGVTGISLTSIIVSQSDRLVLSRLLPLDGFGYYTFAANAAAMISRVVIPVNAAVSPRLMQLVALADKERLREFYSACTQLVAVLVIPLTAVVCALAPQLLAIWTRDPVLTQRVTTVFRILLIGYSLQTLMYLPFTLQLANGWTSLSFFVNLSWIAIMLPGIFLAYRTSGTAGVAVLWVILNLVQIVVTVRIMHTRLLPDVMGSWYKWSVGMPAAVSVAVAGISLAGRNAPILVVVGVFMSTLLSATVILLLAPELRTRARGLLQTRFARSR